VKQKCTSPYCPQKNNPSIDHQTTFSLPAMHSSSKDILGIFPEEGNRCGYCGSQFNEQPSDKAPNAVNDCIYATANTSKPMKFYECKGEFVVMSAAFINKKPWVIPSNIEALSLPLINKLPLTISLYKQKYQLSDVLSTLESTLLLSSCDSRPYFYDGM